MKIICRRKNNYSTFKLTVVLLFVCIMSFSQTDSCSFFGNKPIFPYYYSAPTYNGKDFYIIKKEFTNTITAKTNFNGIVTVNFFINYLGETNFYSTQICDLNYQPLQITSGIEILCQQILQAVKKTSPWKPSVDENKNTINSRKFYSFRFNNGSLIEILPK